MRTRLPGRVSPTFLTQRAFRFKRARHPGLFLIIGLLILLAGCANPMSNNSSSVLVMQNNPAQPTPTATPTPDPSDAARTRVLQIMAGMTLEQKLGQLIMVEYLGNSYQQSGLQDMIANQYVGGVLYQYVNNNFDAPDNTVDGLAAFSRQAQQDAKVPLMLGTDQEGGQVNRLWAFHGPLPSAAEMAQSGNPQYAQDQGAQAAKWMRDLGMNTDLAPVVDVHTVDPPILQDRMFGNTPEMVSTYAGAYLNGLQMNNVIGCLKHFPGLGAVTSDPHVGLPVVNRSMDDLEKTDLAPYKTMIAKDKPAMIMATDVLMPAIDPDLPAELSPKTITGLLRGQLGYNGVVITDGLYMHGITEKWSLSEAAVLAIVAGNDIVEGPYTVSQVAEVVTALKQAIQNGQLSEARIDQSVARILSMKEQYGIIQ